MVYSKFKVGQRCRCLHPGAYRGNDPFTIIKIIPKFKGDDNDLTPRAAYVVEYDDGTQDKIPVKGEGGYLMECVVDERMEK